MQHKVIVILSNEQGNINLESWHHSCCLILHQLCQWNKPDIATCLVFIPCGSLPQKISRIQNWHL